MCPPVPPPAMMTESGREEGETGRGGDKGTARPFSSPPFIFVSCPGSLISRYPCPLVPLSPCPLVPLSPCPLVPLSPCPLVPLSPCLPVSTSPFRLPAQTRSIKFRPPPLPRPATTRPR